MSDLENHCFNQGAINTKINQIVNNQYSFIHPVCQSVAFYVEPL